MTEPLDPLVGLATSLVTRIEAAIRAASPVLAAVAPKLPADVVDDLARLLVLFGRAVAAAEVADGSAELGEVFAEEMRRVIEETRAGG